MPVSGAPDPQALLRGCGLPQAWGGQPAWRILDTGFDGRRFLSAWQLWQEDTQPAQVLHYVALTPEPPSAQALLQAVRAHPALLACAEELASHLWGLLPGFHRIPLAQGRLLLTLCVGDLPALLHAQQFQADSVLLDASRVPGGWDRWDAKALARCCRRGTSLASCGLDTAQRAYLAQAGFELAPNACGRFNPHWEPRTTRQPPGPGPVAPADCLVIGAGLAGASVAAALARRGWQVEVLDAAATPAAGASGLPAGLVLPHVSADDSPRSRLSRVGVSLMLQQAAALLQHGQDWQVSGVLEHRVDKLAALPSGWPAAGRDWSAPAPVELSTAPWAQDMRPGVPSLWHSRAGWIKPARLVQAWLAQPGVRFRGRARIEALRPGAAGWELLDAQGDVLAHASQLVLANAGDAPRLLRGLHDTGWACRLLPPPALQGLRGVLSWGLMASLTDAGLPPFPVNGLGGLIPGVPTDEGRAWYAGATYEAAEAPTPDAGHHGVNYDKLCRLLPVAGRTLADEFHGARFRAWSAVRYAAADRLPLVGPLETGPSPRLWISAAMGSRGLSFAMLCAELLAARLGGEPLPVESALAAKLDVARLDGPICK